MKAAAGEDCAPTFHAFCPEPDPSLPINSSEVNSCDGVTVSEGSASADGQTIDYVVLKGAASTAAKADGEVIYIGLHGTTFNGPTFANRHRMAELAKARGITVVAPSASGLTRSWGYSLLPPLTTADSRVALIDALITAVAGAAPAKAAGDTKIILGGISGGGIMALRYACLRPEVVSGAVVVAAELTPSDLASCTTGGFASVQVHGTSDPIALYDNVPGYAAGAVETFDTLLANNGCDASQLMSATLPVPAEDEPFITGLSMRFTTECASGRGSALVTVEGGGHNWPGYDRASDFPPGANLYGAITNGFDATLQGFDLVRSLDN